MANPFLRTEDDDLPIVACHKPERPSEFRDDEHSLGLAIRDMLALTIWNLLLLGRELSVAFDLLSKRGRGSLFPAFAQAYLPTVERKSIDRWRAAYDAFRTLLPLDEDQTDCPEITAVERFRLTALYRLSRSDASESHRKAALALANQGLVVSEKMADSLVKGDAVKHATPRRHKHTVTLDNGTVEIRVTGDDVAGALRCALAAVSHDAATTDR